MFLEKRTPRYNLLLLPKSPYWNLNRSLWTKEYRTVCLIGSQASGLARPSWLSRVTSLSGNPHIYLTFSISPLLPLSHATCAFFPLGLLKTSMAAAAVARLVTGFSCGERACLMLFNCVYVTRLTGRMQDVCLMQKILSYFLLSWLAGKWSRTNLYIKTNMTMAKVNTLGEG